MFLEVGTLLLTFVPLPSLASAACLYHDGEPWNASNQKLAFCDSVENCCSTGCCDRPHPTPPHFFHNFGSSNFPKKETSSGIPIPILVGVCVSVAIIITYTVCKLCCCWVCQQPTRPTTTQQGPMRQTRIDNIPTRHRDYIANRDVRLNIAPNRSEDHTRHKDVRKPVTPPPPYDVAIHLPSAPPLQR